MKITRRTLLATGISTPFASTLGRISRSASLPMGMYTITFDGFSRSYILYVPQNAPPAPGYPVILGFHGGGETASQFAQQCYFPMMQQAAGYVQIYPQGVQDSWNCGNGWYGYAGANNIDDVGFVQAVVAQVVSTIVIDEARVYATGISLGAEFSASLACQVPQQIAAICQASCSYRGAIVNPGLPMPVMLVKGSADPVSPIAGGGAKNAPPFAALENFWQAANATKGTTTQTLFNGIVTETIFIGGTAQTLAYVVTGMGHQWPIAGDGTDYAPSGLYVGPPCPSPVNLNPAIIQFFSANHR
jgi:polyhydroxybutyrate depolymerase